MPLQHTVKEVELKNGAKGLFILTPGATSVHYEVLFRAGNNYVRRPEISQVAHVLEHMAFAANGEYPSIEAFSQEFTKNGAFSNAHTGSVELSYEADCAILEWDRIMDLQRLSITHPVYSQQLLDAEKGNVSEELSGYLSNDWRILWQTMMRQAGLKRWFDADEIKTLDAITLDDVNEHYTRTHTTNNMRFILVGDLEAHMPKLVEQFEDWDLPKGELQPIDQDVAHSSGLVHINRKQDKNLTFGMELLLNRTLSRRELRALNTLTHILTDTFHSRIWGVARTRGICYGMNSWASTLPSGLSELGFSGEVSVKNARELFTLMIDQLKIVSEEGITEAELAQSKLHRLGGLQMDLESVRSLSGWYSDIYYSTGKIDYVENMPALIEGTTIEEIRSLAKEFIDSGIWTFGGVGAISKKDLQQHYDLFAKKLFNE